MKRVTFLASKYRKKKQPGVFFQKINSATNVFSSSSLSFSRGNNSLRLGAGFLLQCERQRPPPKVYLFMRADRQTWRRGADADPKPAGQSSAPIVARPPADTSNAMTRARRAASGAAQGSHDSRRQKTKRGGGGGRTEGGNKADWFRRRCESRAQACAATARSDP